MHEFYASRRDDGLVETHYPNPVRCVNIPTYSLFWLLMVYNHMVHFGDERLVREYIGAVDGVLNYFDQILTEKGLVGQFDSDSWAFVDWINGWIEPGKGFLGMAVPPAYYRTGSATFHSLLYAYTLLKASELCSFIGRHTGREYNSRKQNIVKAVKNYCFDGETGLFLDGPGATDQFSQHVQTFAILSQCVETKESARELMRKTISRREEFSMAKASFVMGFYLFRAASAAGVYEDSWPVLVQPWEEMMAQNLTTWAESESSVRSDCHAWSARRRCMRLGGRFWASNSGTRRTWRGCGRKSRRLWWRLGWGLLVTWRRLFSLVKRATLCGLNGQRAKSWW